MWVFPQPFSVVYNGNQEKKTKKINQFKYVRNEDNIFDKKSLTSNQVVSIRCRRLAGEGCLWHAKQVRKIQFATAE